MRSLRDRQIAFGAALTSGADSARLAPLVDLLAGPASRNVARLAAYQRNIVGNGRMALASTYPVLRALLGDGFTALADDYLVMYPSRNGDLNQLGDRLPGFLADHPLSGGRPYLPAMASLEWAIQETYDAPQAGTIDFDWLAGLPPAQQAAAVLRLWSGAMEMVTDQPVLTIWNAHQLTDLSDRDRSLAAVAPLTHPHYLKTTRSFAGECGVVALTRGERVLIAACRDKLPLQLALTKAAALDPDFDGGSSLADFYRRGWVAGFDFPVATMSGLDGDSGAWPNVSDDFFR